MPLVHVKRSGAWTDNAPGPNGRRKPPNCPNFSAAATATAATASALQTAITNASAGDVIEYTGGSIPDGTIITGGNKNWTTKVLVRPPYGQRIQVISLYHNAHNVILGGLDIAQSVQVQENLVSGGVLVGTGFWRCVFTQGVFAPYGQTCFMNIKGGSGLCFIENIASHPWYNTTNLGGFPDRMHIVASSNTTESGVIVQGNYFVGGVRGLEPNGPLLDNGYQQPPAVAMWDLGSNTVVTTGTTPATQYAPVNTSNVTYTWNMVNSWIDNPASGDSVTFNVLQNGTIVQTMTVPNIESFSNWSFTTTDTIFNPVSQGDSFDLQITATTGSPKGVHVYVGPASVGHSDILQMYRIPGHGQLGSVRICDNIFLHKGGANTCWQDDGGGIGDHVFENNWCYSYAIGHFSNTGDPTASGALRVNFVGNTMVGNGSLVLNDMPGMFVNNTFSASSVKLNKNNPNPPWVPDASNTFNYPIPSSLPRLPDLNEIWPECPPAAGVV